MIVELAVENLAIIERSSLRLGPGFTALTGETGAGKSLLIDAINLALGDRADADLVRTGAAKASVRITMDLSDAPDARRTCDDLGVPLEDDTLFIVRDVAAAGRSTVRLGGVLSPVGTLKALGAELVDLHGQHDHQSLLDEARHLDFLDADIGPELLEPLSTYRSALDAQRRTKRALDEFRRGLRDREGRLETLRYTVAEIEKVEPKPGEYAELEAKFARLKHSGRLAEALLQALDKLADGENPAMDGVGEGLRTVESVVRFDPSLDEVVEPLREAKAMLDEAIHGVRAYSDELDADPASLDAIAERIDRLKRLRRKYGATEEEILEALDRARLGLEQLESAEESEEMLVGALDDATATLDEAAAALTEMRRERGAVFAERVQSQLRDLAMGRAQFTVDLGAKSPDETGADLVRFFFTANAGESPRPLAKIASGGEISRVMLAIKSAMAGRGGVPTLIFDEIDAGLGGRAAVTVARKLRELGKHYQVVAITHSPQIAAQADDHFRIEKVETGGRVVTQVGPLTRQEREEEIARMLAGETITETSLANARELLAG